MCFKCTNCFSSRLVHIRANKKMQGTSCTLSSLCPHKHTCAHTCTSAFVYLSKTSMIWASASSDMFSINITKQNNITDTKAEQNNMREEEMSHND